MDKYGALTEAQKQIKSAVSRLRHADSQLERYPASTACQDYRSKAQISFRDAHEAFDRAATELGLFQTAYRGGVNPE